MIVHLPTLSERDANIKVPEVLALLEGAGLSSDCITNRTDETNANGVVVKANLTVNLESKITAQQAEDAIDAVFHSVTYSTVQAPPSDPEPATEE